MSVAMHAAVVTEFSLEPWSTERLRQVEDALDAWVTADAPLGLDHGAPAQLVEAMRYAVLDGGKRLRPCWCWQRMRPWEALS